MKKGLLFLFFLMSSLSVVLAQTTIASQGFETGDSWTIDTGSAYISSATGSGDTPSNQRIRTGSMSWQVSNGTRTLELSSQAIANYADVKVIIRLSSTSGSSGNGADGADFVRVFADMGSGFPTNGDVILTGYSNARWGYNATDVIMATAGTSNSFSAQYDDYATIELSVPNGTPSIALRIVAKNNDSNERWNIDDIELVGTLAATNDTDSQAEEGTLPSAATILSTTTTAASAVDVMGVVIVDGGSGDALPTHVTNMRLVPGTNNTADWTDNIGGIVVRDGATTLTPSAVTITDSAIDIAFNSGDLTIADDTDKELTLGVYLNNANIADDAVLQFLVTDTNHGFAADLSGSIFAADWDFDEIQSNEFTIDVDATALEIITQPTNVGVGEMMSPDVEVRYVDANGNIDVTYDGLGNTVNVTTTGTFDAGATTAAAPVAGVATFNNLIFSAAGTGLTLTFNDIAGITNPTLVSNTFDVLAPEQVIISLVTDPNGGSTGTRFVQIKNVGATDKDISGWSILKYANGGITPNSTTIIPAGTTLMAGEVYNIANSSSIFNSSYGCIPDIADVNINGNGNDAYALANTTGVIDVYGVIGNTSSSWNYENKQAVRNTSVMEATDVFDLSQWTISTANVSDIDAGCPVAPVPDNDECTNATVVTCGTSLTGETTAGATKNGEDTGCSLGRGVWYKYVGDNQAVTVNVDGSSYSFDLEFAIATSTDCTSFVEIACVDEEYAGTPEEYTFFANEGVEYFIYVAYYSGNSTITGNFDLSITCTNQDVSAIGNGSCNDAPDIMSTGSGQWLNLFDGSGDIVYSVLDSENMGTISSSVYRNLTGGVRVDGNGVPYLDRNVTISPATQPSGTVKVRLYYRDAEIQALISADPNVNSITDLNMTKEDGSTCTPAFSGNGTLVMPTATGTIGSNHYIELDVTSFSSFFAHSGTTVLPIELLSFTARKQGQNALIEWQTAVEVNNDYMAVERSFDGRAFEEVARIQGAGNSETTQYYKWIDTNPANGINYYRLRQVDFDGKATTFDAQSLVFSTNSNGIVVAPSHANDQVELIFATPTQEAVTMYITDMAGRICKTATITPGVSNHTIDVTQLVQGSYVIRTSNGEVTRFVKL